MLTRLLTTTPEERRVAMDGVGYSKQEFVDYFGEAKGCAHWVAAGNPTANRHGGSSPTAKPMAGQRVAVVQKQDQRTDFRTEGVVADVLTRAATHTRGFKVRLSTGVVGRCVEILDVDPG